MFLLYFFACKAEIEEDDIKYFSMKYKNHIDLKKGTFQCFQDEAVIPLDHFNNDVCECCDGSDEFLNTTIFCENVCPIFLTKSEKVSLKHIYQTAILKRIALIEESQKLYNESLNEMESLKESINETEEALSPIAEVLSQKTNSLKKWVYETNNLPLPDPKEVEKEKYEYIHRKDKVRFVERSPYDEAEEEDIVGSKRKVIDKHDYKVRKNHRMNKWKTIQEEKYQELLTKALEKSRPQPSGSGILGKLKVIINKHEDPPVYKQYMEAKNLYDETVREYTKLTNKLVNVESLFRSSYGKNNIWFKNKGLVLTDSIPGTSNRVEFALLQHAHLILPSVGCQKSIDLGNFEGMINRMHLFTTQPHMYDQQRHLQVRFICYPEHIIFEASQPTTLHTKIVAGAPEVCEESYKQSEFETFLREIQNYKSKIVDESDL